MSSWLPTVNQSTGIEDSSLLGCDAVSQRSFWWLVIGHGGGTVENGRLCCGLCTASHLKRLESAAVPLWEHQTSHWDSTLPTTDSYAPPVSDPFPTCNMQPSKMLSSVLFWNFTQYRMVVCYQNFGTTCQSHLQGSSSLKCEIKSCLSCQTYPTRLPSQ
jgi:hypothetical protein